MKKQIDKKTLIEYCKNCYRQVPTCLTKINKQGEIVLTNQERYAGYNEGIEECCRIIEKYLEE